MFFKNQMPFRCAAQAHMENCADGSEGAKLCEAFVFAVYSPWLEEQQPRGPEVSKSNSIKLLKRCQENGKNHAWHGPVKVLTHHGY